MRGLSLVAASGGHSSSRCAGLSPLRPILLWSTGFRRTGSAVVAHRPSRSTACGILPDQGSNPCPLHRQADSQPLRHQGSPQVEFEYFPLQVFWRLIFTLSYWSEVSLAETKEMGAFLKDKAVLIAPYGLSGSELPR